MTKNKTIYKDVIVSEFDDYYYEKLKKSLPDKIANGEIEWIYSYGEKLIRDGEISVLKKVRELVQSKNCENDYIPSHLLYKKCLSLKLKFFPKYIFSSF